MRPLWVAAFILAAIATAPAQTPDCVLLPGWQQQGPTREFGPDNLFDYMDGNAEGYHAYDDQATMVSRRWIPEKY